jgi:general secretion pathway protein G
MGRSSLLAGFLISSREIAAQLAIRWLNSVVRNSPHAKPRAAFTLIELLVVIAIVAILAALTLSTLGYVNKKAAESRARSEVAALSAAIDSFKLEMGYYPASNNLFTELTGQGPTNTNRVFFEPTATIATNNQFVDPWGQPYNYSISPTNNVGFFDLWTTNNAPTDPTKWIRN